jgi:RimJ/RimL family protein N-acetyltransferase
MTQIRLLNASDAAAWRELRLLGLRLDPDAFRQTHDEAIAQPPETFTAPFAPAAIAESPIFGAFKDGVLVGTCGLKREGQTKRRHTAMLWGVFVAPEARGLGVCRRLLEVAIAHARTLPGLLQLQLTVLTTNAAAIHLYEQHGFTEFGRERRSLRLGDEDFDEAHMVLMLDGSNGEVSHESATEL